MSCSVLIIFVYITLVQKKNITIVLEGDNTEAVANGNTDLSVTSPVQETNTRINGLPMDNSPIGWFVLRLVLIMLRFIIRAFRGSISVRLGPCPYRIVESAQNSSTVGLKRFDVKAQIQTVGSDWIGQIMEN